MQNRNPVVAGQFYPASKSQCLEELVECLGGRPVPNDLPSEIVSGIVPHAGWVFSGSLAGLVFNSIKAVHSNVDTFVLFGAAHSCISQAAVYNKGGWTTPLGVAEIDKVMAAAILDNTDGVIADCEAHAYEHSIEVQVPFIQHLFRQAKIVPIIMPPITASVQIGLAVGDIIKNQADRKIVCIGSKDLTHYGPRYGFSPVGPGQAGIRWAKEVNDKSFIDYAIAVEPAKLLADAVEKHNACGPGAAAATTASAKAQGKTRGKLLAHTDSSDIMKIRYNQPSEESVGYAAIIY